MKRSPERVLRLKVQAMRTQVRLRLRWPDGGADALADALGSKVPDYPPCSVCGCLGVTCFNYRQQPFCGSCCKTCADGGEHEPTGELVPDTVPEEWSR